MSLFFGFVVLVIFAIIASIAYRSYRRKLQQRMREQQLAAYDPSAEMDAAMQQSTQYLYYYQQTNTVVAENGEAHQSTAEAPQRCGVPLLMGPTPFMSNAHGDSAFPHALCADGTNAHDADTCAVEMHPYGTATYLSSPPAPIQSPS